MKEAFVSMWKTWAVLDFIFYAWVQQTLRTVTLAYYVEPSQSIRWHIRRPFWAIQLLFRNGWPKVRDFADWMLALHKISLHEYGLCRITRLVFIVYNKFSVLIGWNQGKDFNDKLIRVCKLLLFPACPLYGLAAFGLLYSRKAGLVKYQDGDRIIRLYFLLDESVRNEFKIKYWRIRSPNVEYLECWNQLSGMSNGIYIKLHYEADS